MNSHIPIRNWRLRAEEAKTLAGQISDPDAKRIMDGIAKGYEQMAQVAEKLESSHRVLDTLERPSTASMPQR